MDPRSSSATGTGALRHALDELERMRALLHDIRNPVGSVSMAIGMLAGPLARSLDQLESDAARRVQTTLDALETSATQLRELVQYESIDSIDFGYLRGQLKAMGPGIAADQSVERTPAVAVPEAPLDEPAARPEAVAPTKASRSPRSRPKRPIAVDDILRRLEILTVTRSALPALLAVDAQPDLEVSINGSDLLRCLSNLVENAIEASANADPGQGPWTVEIVARGDADTVSIEVRNRGQGLPESMARWLEQPAESAVAPPSTKTEGALHGVGLGAARTVTESAGGQLQAWDDGNMSTVALRLPRLPSKPVEEAI